MPYKKIRDDLPFYDDYNKKCFVKEVHSTIYVTGDYLLTNFTGKRVILVLIGMSTLPFSWLVPRLQYLSTQLQFVVL